MFICPGVSLTLFNSAKDHDCAAGSGGTTPASTSHEQLSNGLKGEGYASCRPVMQSCHLDVYVSAVSTHDDPCAAETPISLTWRLSTIQSLVQARRQAKNDMA